MTDSSEADLPPQTNGVSDSMDDEERAKIRPADIDADVREMERRKRVEIIMNSRMFREELERIIEHQLKDGSGTTGLMQQISDMMGVNRHAGNVFKNSNCVVPINDIRGIEAMGYAKGEKILRCKLAAVFRIVDLYGWARSPGDTLVTARLNQDEEHFLVSPYGMMFHEMTASSLIKVAMQGDVIEQGTTNFSVNMAAFSLHAAVHAARPDIRCIINVNTPAVVAVSALKQGILPLSQEAAVVGEVSAHAYLGGLLDDDEKDRLARNLGPINKVLLLSNQGALCCGETIEEAFFNARNTVFACESQLKLLPAGIDNLVLLNEEVRKKLYDAAHKAPDSSPRPDQPSILEGKVERKWRVGGVEFEGLMRMLDNAGFRTGYIYRHPLVKGDPPRPRNDVEVPPAVSSLGYLLEEEELYRQGLWRKLEGGRKGHDRSRWLNSPNVYQKVEILETGTPDPKKITKWVAEASPTHSSTPVKIDAALQFVPKGTNPKEFKQKQQQIKDYRRADKISAGPQSHILEGVTWEEARKMQDATVTQTGDQVVLMGAASKGIIQRGHQHNAMVYKSPYAKNPFDSVTDEELDEYKKVVEKKVKGEYDTDFSESEGLSSAQINRRMADHLRSPTSETEEESRDEPQVLRIQTKQAPRPSQPEVVLSDADTSATEQFLRSERVSVNSYKSVRAVSVKRHLRYATAVKPGCYRTNSHAGLPKGSYAVPNPKHFHVVHQTETPRPLRPILLKIGPQIGSPHYVFNRFNINCDRNTSTVTINIGNVRTVSLGMSMQTITDFIYPFANALNMVSDTKRVSSQESQTSYVLAKDFTKKVGSSGNQYTPLIEEVERDEFNFAPEIVGDDSSTFEREILQKLKENLVNDLTARRNSESEISGMTDFDETTFVTVNESMVDMSHLLENGVANLSGSDNDNISKTDDGASKDDECNFEVDENFNYVPSGGIEKVPPVQNVAEFTDDVDQYNIDEVTQTVRVDEKPNDDLITNDIQDVHVEESANDEMIHEETPYADIRNVHFEEYPVDENPNDNVEDIGKFSSFAYVPRHKNGLDDTLMSQDSLECQSCCHVDNFLGMTNLDVDDNSARLHNDNVIQLGQILFYYIADKCFDNRMDEKFPELLNNTDTSRLYAELIKTYKEIYGNTLKADDKDHLKLCICSYVIDLVETDEQFAGMSDSTDSEILSDKLFCISEYLSDVITYFFDLLEDENTTGVEHDEVPVKLKCSTPDKGKKQYEQITTFRKEQSAKFESYWFAITNSPLPPPQTKPFSTRRKVVNVDDIPLPIPVDLQNVKSPELSPIAEEPRVNLMFAFDAISDDDRVEQDPPSSSPDLFADAVTSPQNDDANDGLGGGDTGEKINHSGSYFAFDKVDEFGDRSNFGGILTDKTLTYITVDQPEVNVVVSNAVSFFRTLTTNTSAYVQSDRVQFNTKITSVLANGSSSDCTADDTFYSINSKDGENDEGNWMGFERAKF